MDGLWFRSGRDWLKVSAEVCQHLIESMPRGIEATIKAGGEHAKH